MPKMRLWFFTFRQFRGTKFSILNIVLISVTPWIALLMRNIFFWIITAYFQCIILSTKSNSVFIWTATLQSSKWPCRPRICALYQGSGNQFNIGGRFGLFSEAWQTQTGMGGSWWDKFWWLDHTRDIAKKCHQPLRPSLCHQWLGRRY